MPMFDTNMLGYLFRSPDEKALVHDGQTGEVVDQLVTRIAHLVDTLNDTGADIIFPAPAYAECVFQRSWPLISF